MSNNDPTPQYMGNRLEQLPTEVSLGELQADSQKRWQQQGGTQATSDQSTPPCGITGVPKPDGESPGEARP